MHCYLALACTHPKMLLATTHPFRWSVSGCGVQIWGVGMGMSFCVYACIKYFSS